MSSMEASGDGPHHQPVPVVELTVKSANQTFDDLIVQFENTSSVKQLKERITEQYPCKLVSCCCIFLFLVLVLSYQFFVFPRRMKTTQIGISFQLIWRFFLSQLGKDSLGILLLGWVSLCRHGEEIDLEDENDTCCGLLLCFVIQLEFTWWLVVGLGSG